MVDTGPEPTYEEKMIVPLPCAALSYPTLPYPTLPYPTLPYPTLPYPTLPYPTLPCHALPYPTLPYLTLPCPALPCPALPCPALPCPALPCPALPCPTLPCPTLPYPTLPYPTIPYPTIVYRLTLTITVSHFLYSQRQEGTFCDGYIGTTTSRNYSCISSMKSWLTINYAIFSLRKLQIQPFMYASAPGISKIDILCTLCEMA